ncbi:MAG TPA: 2'-5' RNA ligase family protein, partial [Acetobacteraceae bacterium]
PDPSDAMKTDGVSQELRSAHGLTGKPLRSDLLHMTLLHFGDIPGLQQATVDQACHIARRMSVRPFEITFDRVKSFHNPRTKQPFVLLASKGNAGLLLFQRELEQTMKNAGLVHRKPLPFRPHATLVWDFASVREMPLDATMTWTAREFFLIFSVFGQSHHECLGRWPLKG